jgi:hypothetical protein
MVGGAVARINGGQFAQGFISGAFTKSVTNFINNPVSAAIVGGTASELVGGKFANGAISAAFGYVYNSIAHDQKYSDIQNATLIPGAEDQYDMRPGEIAGYVALTVVLPEMIFARIGAYFGVTKGISVLGKVAKGRVFWSGPGAKGAAESFAKANGAQTLEVTLAGKALDKITTPGNFKYVKPLWNAASKNFAKGAKGPVDVFQSSKGVRLESVWAKKEFPILKQQGNNINYHLAE